MDLLRASDERLIKALSPKQAGEAFAEFYRRHERAVLAFHVRRIGNPEVAADLAATTFIEALAARGRFRSRGEGSATAWLFGIASHVVSHHYRRTEAEARRYEKLVQGLPALSASQAEEIAALADEGPLMQALAGLPVAQRDAVWAYVLAEDTYAEIAQRESIDPTTARKRVSRGLAALRANAKETP